jgi:biphenyl 2,3-dioxygenase beta subunit
MTIDENVRVSSDLVARTVRQYAVEQFYSGEAALLDAHNYTEWVQLFSDDTHYFMPIRRTRLRRELHKEFTKPGEIAFFDETKQTLMGRVAKIATGTAWAEDPPSRTRHLVTNVRVTEDRGDELDVASNFIVYRTRLKSEETTWIGSRIDVLRRQGESFLIVKRLILLDQTLLLSQNLSNFF